MFSRFIKITSLECLAKRGTNELEEKSHIEKYERYSEIGKVLFGGLLL